ncbi:MAG: 30S ribosomal protein S6 [Deltaproteobacteria bacterium]|nr:30S ribosomal protein S6 [Deltaproteobacteria bacterium]
MNHYETIVIVQPQLPDAGISTIQKKIETLVQKYEGTISKWDDWGSRKLSYKIKKQTSGHYVYILYEAKPQVVREIENMLNLSEDILKHLTIRRTGGEKNNEYAHSKESM